jgi:SAM-dependent methyltransferase
MILSDEQLATEATPSQEGHFRRPSFRWSDLWKAPLNDFPIRDEILYQYLPLEADLDVLEIGPGSGSTAFGLSRLVRHMTLADATPEPVSELQNKFRQQPNIRCLCADIGMHGLMGVIEGRYDIAFGLDVFEYVRDPRRALANLAELLRPNGELFLSFPNVPPPLGDGVTYFERSDELERMLHEAGFRKWAISAVRLNPYAACVYRILHETPLRIYRRLRSNPAGKPQTYDAVWAFHNRRVLEHYKVPVHLLWMLIRGILYFGGDVFVSRPVNGNIFGHQLVIRAWK